MIGKWRGYMKKHISIFIVAVLIALQLLTGCSGKDKKGETSKKGTVRFTTFYSSKEQGALYKELAKEFEKQHKGIKVEVITDYGDDESIKESISKKGDIDIVGLRRDQVIDYAKSGFITDLSDFVEKNELSRKLYKVSLAYGKYNGKVYGIGDMPMTMEWFYNVDIFKKYGLKEPDNLAQLKDICSKLKAKKVTPLEVGAMDGWTLSTLFGMITAQTTGVSELTSNYGSDESAFKSLPGITDAFKIYGDIAKSCIPSNSIDINYRASVDDFVKGKAAILPAMSHTMELIEKIKPSSFQYSVFEMPVKFVETPVSNISASGGQVIAIPSNSKNRKEAETFIEFLASEDAQKIITDKGYISPMISANSSENKVKSQILSHMEMADDNSIMIVDNLDLKMSENVGKVLQDILEGHIKAAEGWNRVLKLTFKK